MKGQHDLGHTSKTDISECRLAEKPYLPSTSLPSLATLPVCYCDYKWVLGYRPLRHNCSTTEMVYFLSCAMNMDMCVFLSRMYVGALCRTLRSSKVESKVCRLNLVGTSLRGVLPSPLHYQSRSLHRISALSPRFFTPMIQATQARRSFRPPLRPQPPCQFCESSPVHP